MARIETQQSSVSNVPMTALESALAEQRREIGRDLHDNLGQKLTGLGMLASALARSLPSDSARSRERLEHLVNGLEEAVSEVRKMSHGLVEGDTKTISLAEDLSKIAHQTGVRTDTPCRFEQHQDADVRDPQISGHLCRIAQEAVNNAVRHGDPGSITLALRRRGPSVTLEIRDDGRGLRHTGRTRGVGMRNMISRARKIGAALKVLSSGEKGTVVICSMPRQFA